MEYKVGDKVKIKPFCWCYTNKDESGLVICLKHGFTNSMSEYCGKEATIVEVFSEDSLKLDIDNGAWKWSSDMFEGNDSQEIILCAAIHYDNGIKYPHQEGYRIKKGFVLAGYRHHNITPILPENPFMKPQEDLNVEWGNNENHICIQGFITSKGRFVNREEAAKIALASGQIKKLQYSKDKLFSEDLY